MVERGGEAVAFGNFGRLVKWAKCIGQYRLA